MSSVVKRPMLYGVAVVGVVLSGLLSFVMLTPGGWGLTWSELAPSWGAKLFFFAPIAALIAAGLAKFSSRPSPSQEVAMLAAPTYQAIYLTFSYFAAKPGA